MRNSFAETFYEVANDDARLAIVVADISPAGSIARFREECPDRFVNTGVAEQIMIGLVAGMALRGMRPFAYTIATFTLYRPFEFVRSDIAYQGLPVTLVGIGGGVTYSTLGGTHHAMEDIAIASAVPNMTVLAPCDPAEVREATLYCARDSAGPVYLRLGKAGEPDLTGTAIDPFQVGRIRYLRRGTDSCVLSYGPTVKLATEVADRLAADGESVSVISVHTLKPLDVAGIREALGAHRRVIVVEEHAPYGGLGPRVKEIAWDAGADCEIRTFALQDAFIHAFGSHGEVLAAHGLDADTLVRSLVQD